MLTRKGIVPEKIKEIQSMHLDHFLHYNNTRKCGVVSHLGPQELLIVDAGFFNC